MSVDSFKHKKDKRKLIPSKEEAGTEKGNKKVTEKEISTFPKNPVNNRGYDPELFWMNKYGPNELEDVLKVDIRSLYRSEHISPEILIKNFYKLKENGIDDSQQSLFQSFGNGLVKDEIQKISEYYKHDGNWSNRLILGDSLLVMNSLLEREGLSNKVQMVYFDPPYGIKYGSNWQIKLGNRNVKDGDDNALTGEPEQIKAYRDTWELGIHSYLSYLRDRLIIAKELLTESGSCFVQISDENVHLVRSIMDEVFGSENFVNIIIFQKTGYLGSKYLDSTYDFILWYAKKSEFLKYRQLYVERDFKALFRYNYVENINCESEKLTKEQLESNSIPVGKRWRDKSIMSDGETSGDSSLPFNFKGITYKPNKGKHWSTGIKGLERLNKLNRLIVFKDKINFKSYLEDFPVIPIGVYWPGMMIGTELDYVVQTNIEVIKRCILLSTEPGDLILDPTCGSGTSAFVAEQWGRRWITIDTSRIALNISKTRLMTATFPYYKMHDHNEEDIKQGFIYKTVPHITLKSLANDEPPAEETLFDQPLIDNKRLRVTGPFTVETLQNYDSISPDELRKTEDIDENFEKTIYEMLKSAGIKNGLKNEHAVFKRVESLRSPYLNAEGFFDTSKGERKAYFHIGPKFGTVSKQVVNEAVKECRTKGDADWLVILGFSFESDIVNENITTSAGTFEVTKVRMHDDLIQEGLLKRDKKAASFVTIGEPDIDIEEIKEVKKDKKYTGNKKIRLVLKGIDIYDPIKDEVKSRDVDNIAYWVIDDDYDGSNFIVRQALFCGDEGDEYEKMKKSLKKLEKTLKIEIDEDAYQEMYSDKSRPIEIKNSNQKIAVKVISQFGEETMKVMRV